MQILSDVERRSLEQRSLKYHHQLLSEGTDLLDYLIGERGLEPETLSRFRLGAVVNPDGLDEPARGKISIPYMTPSGVVSMRFRRGPADEGPKYWQPAGTKITIFNVNALVRPASWIVITEGEMDCITAAQAGLPAVGIPGVSAWKDHYPTLFEGYERVIICADNDDKGQGQDFAERVAEVVPAPAIFTFPEGHDLNSFYVEHGTAALRSFLNV